MTNQFSPRDIVIALRGEYEAPGWTTYLIGRIAENLGPESTLRWWSEAGETEIRGFFTAILGKRLGQEHADKEWKRVMTFWSKKKHASLPSLVSAWKKKTKELSRKNIATTTFFDPTYPAELVEIDEPPAVLWSTQPLNKLVPQRLAVIGSRDMSASGARSTRALVVELAGTHGLGIVSGCARGIDWVAHETALKAKGQTIGILGCGIDRMPDYCRELSRNPQVIWISEFSPSAEASKWRFPFRNRLIAALSKGVLVIEGGPHSGTLITARVGLEMGREVMVLSADPHNKNTEVLQKLITDSSARVVVTLENILDCLAIPRRKGRRCPGVSSLATNPVELLFLRQLVQRGGRALTLSLTIPDCIDSETWENTRFELESRGIITERLGTCELTGMVQS